MMPFYLDPQKTGKRKTAHLVDMIREVNRRNEMSTCCAETRQGWNCILETFLHHCNVYAGFGYLSADSVPEGEKPGIVRDAFPENEGKPGRCCHDFPDETRRVYYIHHSLTKGEKRS